MVFGTFDGFHEGHRFVLREAEKRGEVFVVVARDTNVERIKGRPPRQKEELRLTAIQNEFPSMQILFGDTEDFLVPIKDHRPDLILLGYDQMLPPGIDPKDLPKIERLSAFHPEKYKSSLLS